MSAFEHHLSLIVDSNVACRNYGRVDLVESNGFKFALKEQKTKRSGFAGEVDLYVKVTVITLYIFRITPISILKYSQISKAGDNKNITKLYYASSNRHKTGQIAIEYCEGLCLDNLVGSLNEAQLRHILREVIFCYIFVDHITSYNLITWSLLAKWNTPTILYRKITWFEISAKFHDRVTDVIVQVLQGVNFLHKLGIAHRDLKPDNVSRFRREISVKFRVQLRKIWHLTDYDHQRCRNQTEWVIFLKKILIIPTAIFFWKEFLSFLANFLIYLFSQYKIFCASPITYHFFHM